MNAFELQRKLTKTYAIRNWKVTKSFRTLLKSFILTYEMRVHTVVVNSPDRISQPVPSPTPSNSTDSRAPMIAQRRAQIAALVRTAGAQRVADLAERFQVSEVTIRGDLMQLEKQGQLVRDRGGALPLHHSRELTSLLAVETRAHLQIDEKQRIAHAAARLVSPGDTILMDAGTTVVEMAPHLAGITPLTVVTNALNVALEVAAKTDAQVILLGGTLSRESSSVLGSLAENALGELLVQKAFLGTQAFDLEHGFTDTTLEIAQVKRAMIRSARRVILLSDSSKLGRTGFIKVAPLTAVHTLITDIALPPDARTALEALGIEVLAV
jgi:DeoR/GlpR family transcriptional regulator of sugar metabolism